MFIRDPWTTLTMQEAGSPLTLAGGEPTVAEDQVMLRRLHALARSIYQATQDVKAAQARNDSAYAQARLQDIKRLRDLFAETAAQFTSTDSSILATTDLIIANVGTWLLEPFAIVPDAILDGVTRLGVKAGVSALTISLPIFALGALAVYFLLYAEKSRTVRRLVR